MLKLCLFVLGVIWCAGLAQLPSLWSLGGLGVLALLVARTGKGRWSQTGLLAFCLLAGLFYADMRAQWRLAQALPAAQWQQPVYLQGVVRDLPVPGEYGLRMRMDVEQVLTPGAVLPERVQLMLFAKKGESMPQWHAGQRWRLTARFRPRQATANPYGFDAEQWLWSEGVLASGSVLPGAQYVEDAQDPGARVDRLREGLVLRIDRVLGRTRAAGLVAGLTVGAQQGIARQEWQSLSRTGLTHVVSISGLHITMVAGMVASVVS